MQRFYTPVHHLRKTCDFGDVADIDACIAQRFCGAAGADDLDVEARELACEIYDAGFVRNTD